MTDMRKHWTEAEIEEFEERYQTLRSAPDSRKRVYVPELDREFASILDCSRYFRVSPETISRALKRGGAFGDFTLKQV